MFLCRDRAADSRPDLHRRRTGMYTCVHGRTDGVEDTLRGLCRISSPLLITLRSVFLSLSSLQSPRLGSGFVDPFALLSLSTRPSRRLFRFVRSSPRANTASWIRPCIGGISAPSLDHQGTAVLSGITIFRVRSTW